MLKQLERSRAKPHLRDVDDLEDWVVNAAADTADMGDMLDRLSRRMNDIGIPVARATTMIQTLHPRYVAGTRIWYRGRGAAEDRTTYSPDGSEAYRRSPMKFVRENNVWMDVRIDRPHGYDIPMFDKLASEGLTHYLIAPVRFSDGTINGISWASDHPDGFSEEHVAIFRRLLAPLRLVIEIKGLRRIMPEILAAYVGQDPANRILNGAIHPGDVQNIDAAMLVCDLRGFTTLSNVEAPDKVVQWLNRYFSMVVPAIEEFEGEILKFMGDGVLAAFPVSAEPDKCDAPDRALKAGMKILDSLSCVGREDCEFDGYNPVVALHVGRVAYGNIGAGSRLDFTAIGSDVNLVSRLETRCKQLGECLVMSERFARHVTWPVKEIEREIIPGFADPVGVFRLDGYVPGR